MQIVAKTRDAELARLMRASKAGPKLVKAAKKTNDNLLRALIPLYIARSVAVRVTSGGVSRFWNARGISISGPAVARAWREWVGYSRQTKTGPQITPNGVNYVNAALRS